jgi:hypothetical protein
MKGYTSLYSITTVISGRGAFTANVVIYHRPRLPVFRYQTCADVSYSLSLTKLKGLEDTYCRTVEIPLYYLVRAETQRHSY